MSRSLNRLRASSSSIVNILSASASFRVSPFFFPKPIPLPMTTTSLPSSSFELTTLLLMIPSIITSILHCMSFLCYRDFVEIPYNIKKPNLTDKQSFVRKIWFCPLGNNPSIFIKRVYYGLAPLSIFYILTIFSEIFLQI